MRAWFRWKGVKCTAIGVIANVLPEITMPLERVSYTSVPGRSGTLTQTEGEDVYDDIVLTVECSVENGKRLGEVMRYLKGADQVEFSNRPGGFYYARVSNQIPFEKILRGRPNRRFAVSFRCKPFWYVSEEADVEMNEIGWVENEGSVYAEPIITVRGSGDGVLLVGENMIELKGMEGEIIIDSTLQEVYDAQGESKNACMTGEFPRLAVGRNEIGWSGGITGVTIRKNTRYL